MGRFHLVNVITFLYIYTATLVEEGSVVVKAHAALSTQTTYPACWLLVALSMSRAGTPNSPPLPRRLLLRWHNSVARLISLLGFCCEKKGMSLIMDWILHWNMGLDVGLDVGLEPRTGTGNILNCLVQSRASMENSGYS